MTNRELISVARKNILEIGKIADSAMEGLLAENESLQNQLIQRNDELLKLREQVPRWISLEERLPENEECVLCHCTNGKMRVLRYDHIMDDWDFTVIDGHGYAYPRGTVTHWMPLPGSARH